MYKIMMNLQRTELLCLKARMIFSLFTSCQKSLSWLHQSSLKLTRRPIIQRMILTSSRHEWFFTHHVYSKFHASWRCPPSIFCIGILIDMLILKVMSKITPLVKNCIVEVQHMMNCRQQKFDSCGMDYLNSAGKFPEWIHQSNVIWIWHLQQGRSPSSKSSHGSFLNNYWIDCYKSSRVIVSTKY